MGRGVRLKGGCWCQLYRMVLNGKRVQESGKQGQEELGAFPLVRLLLPSVIHPRDKQDVAHRLVLGARAIGYNEAYTEFQGPYPRRVCGITNNKIVVDYQFSDVKLISRKLFEVCCYDEVTCDLEPDAWKTADVVYQVNSTSVMLGYQCDKTYSATYLRYLWKDMPCEFKNCAVYGAKNDLPGPPLLSACPELRVTTLVCIDPTQTIVFHSRLRPYIMQQIL
ncbi:putative sialate O-acetylesterase-like [Apostichopus japonicus]|uniref:Putative sialate O-acetylesterase-like n=1 Tax=Stichopus japonicus TaxID=307972 RepID=A0A2G8JJV1_STIJA|nr:putative sialate O-acetylesterase-like [Apostichopus japonicus]